MPAARDFRCSPSFNFTAQTSLFEKAALPSFGHGRRSLLWPTNESFNHVTPYFASVIVTSIDFAAAWYQRAFKLKPIMRDFNDRYGYKVVIMESQEFVLELMELKGSLSAREIVATKA